MKRGFKKTLQNKLVAAFLFVGLVPMVLSTLIVVSMNSRRLAARIEKDIKKASEETMKVIQDYQNRAEQIANFHLDNPRFVDYLRSGKAPQVIRTGQPLILWIAGKSPGSSCGKDIIQLESPHLIAGTIAPVTGINGTCMGNLIIGYQLGKSFAQDMSMHTDVEVSILYKRDEPSDGSTSQTKLMEEIFKSGNACYDKNAMFQDIEYEAYYQPIRTKSGRIVGIVFCGVPKRYGFLATVSTWRFFPIMIGLCAIMAGSLGYTMAKRISKPIRLFSNGVRAVAEGNLDQEINITSSVELAELSNAFNHMIQKLRELRQIEEELRRKDRLAALGELSAGVAHEIRNPLGIIRSSAQMLGKSSPNNEKTEELTTFIIGEVDRLNRVVSNFLDFARPQTLNVEAKRIEDIIDKSLHLAKPKLSQAHVEIIRDYGKNTPGVEVDAELLSEAFLNLIINAAEAMENGGRLTISLHQSKNFKFPKGCVEINFTDTGTGIPEQAIGKIFNPFFSGKDKGSGLGLAIVHKIIEAHNGQILVKSRSNHGSVFTVRLTV